MKKIVLATKNSGKVREYNELCKDWKVEFLSLADVGLGELDILEDGSTFMENALIKAQAVVDLTDYAVMADDSGLSIDAFEGAPGIHSARFLPELNYKEKKAHILKELEGKTKEERQAHFTCALVYADDDFLIQAEGVVKGIISHEDVGEQGFGYDGIFFYEEDQCTFGQMDEERKDQVSHRAIALRKLESMLRKSGIIG